MKKILLLTCAMLSAIVTLAQEQFSIGELTYEVTGANTVTVWKINESATTVVIPAMVNKAGVIYNVTSIGKANVSPNYGNRGNLVSVTIPNSVTSIGYEVFSHCDNLSSINIPNSVLSIGERAFYHCDALTSVYLPENITIASDAFMATGGVIVDGMTYGGGDTLNIGNYTLYNTGFMSFYIGANAYNSQPTKLSVVASSSSISGDLVIPSTLQLNGNNYPIICIEGKAFYKCEDLTSVTIPNTIVYIGRLTDFYGAFEQCSSLTWVVLPNSISTIGAYAFYDCGELSLISIPNSVENIGNLAFAQCSSLNTVTLPENSNIHQNAFKETGSVIIDDITYGGNDSLNIGNYILYNTGFMSFTIGENTYSPIPSKASVIACDTSKSGAITLPSTIEINSNQIPVTFIKGKAFFECGNLTSISLPNTITAIGSPNDNYGAFELCENLTSISLPNNLSFIGDYTFLKCGNLLSIDIPSTVTYIGAKAFANCRNLFLVNLPENATIFENAFQETGTIVEDEITYGGYDTLNVGNYTFYHTGFMTFNLGDNILNPYPTKVCIISCATSKNGDFIIPPVVELYGNTSYIVFIKGKAFYRCEDITSITVPNSVIAIGTLSDDYGAFERCTNLASISLPNSLTCLGNYTFWNCNNLTSVVVPDSVRNIGKGAFHYCNNLTNVVIGNGVESLYPKLFLGAESLTDVVLGNNISFIGRETFSSCTLLENVECMANIPPFIENNTAFALPNTANLIVPCGSLEAYSEENSLWYMFFEDRIEQDCSGIKEAEELDVEIINDNRIVNILSEENNLQIEVYNLLGRKVFATKDYKFTLNNVSAGVYMVKVFSNQATKTEKIILR